MRVAALALAFLLLAGHVPVARAQEPTAPAQLLEDARGDQMVHSADPVPGASPAGRFQAADLLSLAVQESPSDFTFRLAVASLTDSTETALESTQYGIRFMHNGAQYQVHVFRGLLTQASYGAQLEALDTTRQRYDTLADLPVTADAPGATMTVTVDRDQLLDQDGVAPFPGRSLAGFSVVSWGGALFGDGTIGLGPGGQVSPPKVQVTDAMPDAGNGTLGWPVQYGIQQSGNARLSSAVPTRASNGEATTFVFSVVATNLGPTQRFHLAATGVPGAWNVQLPSDLIELDKGQNETLPVLVTTPFAHQHGTLQSFTLEMQGLDQAGDVGRVQLGVRYTQPPQPAGHHDTVYLHTAKPQGDQTFNTLFGTAVGFDFGQMYFNTLTPDEDNNDAKTPVGGQEDTFIDFPPAAGVPTVTYTWDLPLSPALQMGLDVDMARTGDAKLSFDTLLPMPGAVLTGRIVHTAPDGRSLDDCRNGCDFTGDDFRFGFGNHTTVLKIGPSPAQDVQPNSQDVLFEAPVTGLAKSRFVPFVRDATLVLEVNLTFNRVDPFFGPHDTPKLAGGELTLPLLEYHDPVDRAFSSLAGLMVQVQGEASRQLNPGKTALFELELMNHGDKDAAYDLSLSGTNLPWARILGDDHVKVPAGGVRTLGIAVTAPAEARDGDTADLVLTAADAKDPSIRTLARVVATVDTHGSHPDDSAKVPGLESQLRRKSSPAADLLPLLAVLGVAVLLVRRRQRRA